MKRRNLLKSVSAGLMLALGKVEAQESQSPFQRINVGSAFKNSTITIDGQGFEHCTFDNCILVYGGGPLHMVGNQIIGSHFELVGAAARTAILIQSINDAVPMKVQPPRDTKVTA